MKVNKDLVLRCPDAHLMNASLDLVFVFGKVDDVIMKLITHPVSPPEPQEALWMAARCKP